MESSDSSSPSLAQPTVRRRPWLAGLLTLLIPGAGHAYVGAPHRAAAFWAADHAVGLAWLAALLFAPAGTLTLVVLGALYVAWRLGLVALAWRAARAPSGVGSLWSRRRRWLAVVAFVAIALLLSALIQAWLKREYVESFKIPSDAMAPTILTGDYLMASRLDTTRLHHGQVAIYQWASEDGAPAQQFVKRIVGLPGDTLAMEAGVLIRNGERVTESYLRPLRASADGGADEMRWQRTALTAAADSAGYRPTRQNWGPLIVPEAAVFILGDSRDNSLDSRYIGFIPVRSLTKQPRRIYLSVDPETGSLRWDRMGRRF